MTRVATRPLDRAAVAAADRQLYARYANAPRPNALYDASGKKKPLDPHDPSQADLRSEWMDLYEEHGGEIEDSDDQPDTPPDEPVQPCPYAGDDEEPEEPTPTITARWSKSEVTPRHNSQWPPSAAPDDDPPEEAKVEMIVDVTETPDGTGASITVRRCVGGATVPDGEIANLEVRGGQVVDPATGQRPVFYFEARHDPWAVWNKPFFYFAVSVDHAGLAAETPKDFDADPASCLRVLLWSVAYAVSDSGLAGVLPEANGVRPHLDKPALKSRCDVENRPGQGATAAQVGSLLRNSWAVIIGSHGNLVQRGTHYPAYAFSQLDDNPPVVKPGGADDALPAPASNWRSTSTIIRQPNLTLVGTKYHAGVTVAMEYLGDAEIVAVANFPSVPKALLYLSECVAGWEPSYANAVMGRGCRNVLAFRMFIPDAEAITMAGKFFQAWSSKKLDPEKIPDAFFETAPDHWNTMMPVLFGAGGGPADGGGGGLSAGEVAAIAIAAVAVGVLVGVALYAALK